MKIGIIGLGLIGGSLLKVLASQGFEMYAVTRNPKTIKDAKPLCCEVSSDFSILKSCEVVFVAVPMSNVLETLEKLETVLPSTALVTDVSSLKSFVMQKKYSFNFIGSHPMAGTENAGYENSFAELFEDAKWVITPFEDTSAEKINLLKDIILQTGANVVYAGAKEHDMAVAKISHMPMLISQALMHMVKDDKLALELASSGFRDTTRLAMSNVDMAEDMVNMNTKNIEKSFCDLQNSIRDLKISYKEKISEIRSLRKQMYDENGKNTY